MRFSPCGSGLSSLDFAWRLYCEAGVSMLDAAACGEPAQRFVRLSFTVSDDQLARACVRIKSFVSTLDKSQEVVS